MTNTTNSTVNKSIAKSILTNGYDFPIYGFDNDTKFYVLHITALICTFISMISAICVLIASFAHQKARLFFTWSKSQRFVVYLAVCDFLFNFFHAMDHLQITITRDHVYPKFWCEFNACLLVSFQMSQTLLVNIICINIFMLMFFNVNLPFGKYDYRILLLTYLAPFIGPSIALGMNTLGTTGAFCAFDPINGELANLLLAAVPMSIIFITNVVLYTLTWYRIRKDEPRFKDKSGNDAENVRASHVAARNMSLFVAAYFLQWWAMATLGISHIINKAPHDTFFLFVAIFSNIGGLLNGIVYITMRRKGTKITTSTTKSKVSSIRD